MSFFYQSNWSGMSGGCIGCGLGAWTASDFTPTEIQKSKDVGNALESLSTSLGNRGLSHSDAGEKVKALAAQTFVDGIFTQTGLRAGGDGPLSIDDDDKIHKVHEMLSAFAENNPLMAGELLAFVDKTISIATAGRILDLDSLSEDSGTLYDLYFDKYFTDDSGTPAGTTKPPVTDPATGKVKVPKAKKPVKKSGIGVFGWVAILGVAAGAGYIALSSSKKRRY